MDHRSASTTTPAPGAIVRTADQEPWPVVGASPTPTLRLAAGIGLVAGWLDLGMMVVKKRLIDGDFYRLGEHFVWLIPTGVAVLVLLPGIVLALIARLRRTGVRPGLAVGLPTFVGALDLCARLPFELWASLLLSGGLAIQAARLVDRRRRASFELSRRTTPWLVGILLAVMLAMIGRRAWSDHRARAAL